MFKSQLQLFLVALGLSSAPVVALDDIIIVPPGGEVRIDPRPAPASPGTENTSDTPPAELLKYFEEPLRSLLPRQAEEIMLEGTIEGISFATKQLTMSVNAFTLPNGKSSALEPGRLKVVQFSETTPVQVAPVWKIREGVVPAPKEVPVWTLWPMRTLAVVGPVTPTGKPMSASRIELFEESRGSATPGLFTSQETRWFGGVPDFVADTGLRVASRFGIKSVGGRSARGSSLSDHPRGLALDFMVGQNSRLGDVLAGYFEAYAGLENVKYIIWKDKLVYPGSRTDWSQLPVDYGPGFTARHMDHVHVSFLESPRRPGPWLEPATLENSRLASHSKRR